MKILWNDCETTGLDEAYHEVIQITAIVEDDGKFIDAIDLKIRPNHPDRFSEEAMEKTGLTIDQIMQWPTREDQFKKLIAFLDKHVDKFDKEDKMTMAGYHNLFDQKFIRAYFKEQGHKYFGSYIEFEVIDVMVIAMLLRKLGALDIPNLKLRTVAAAVGINFDEAQAHNAIYDVKQTIAAFYKMEKMFELKE